MLFKKIDTKYVSEIDNLLQDFDIKHPEKSSAQREEIKKHKPIFEKRDNPNVQEEKSELWEDF